MFVPCPFTLHVECNYFNGPIRKIGNNTYIINIPIIDLYTVLVPIHDQVISSANVGHSYWDTHIGIVTLW